MIGGAPRRGALARPLIPIPAHPGNWRQSQQKPRNEERKRQCHGTCRRISIRSSSASPCTSWRASRRGWPACRPTPRSRLKIGFDAIARAVSVPSWAVHEISDHVEALAKTYGLEDPVAAARLKAIAAIAKTYAGRPLPSCNNRPYLSRIAAEAKLTMWIVNSTTCRAAIAALAKTNGLRPVVKDVEAETALIDAYRERLLASGELLPWNYGLDRIDTPAVAAATGVAQFRLRAPTLAPAMSAPDRRSRPRRRRHLRRRGRPAQAFVDRAIAERGLCRAAPRASPGCKSRGRRRRTCPPPPSDAGDAGRDRPLGGRQPLILDDGRAEARRRRIERFNNPRPRTPP